MLEAEELIACRTSIGEVGHSSLGYHLSAELGQRNPRVLLLKSGSGGCHQMKAYLAVGANVGEQASFADISALDNPDLAGGRTHLSGDLLSS
jgi:hypothetical protein